MMKLTPRPVGENTDKILVSGFHDRSVLLLLPNVLFIPLPIEQISIP